VPWYQNGLPFLFTSSCRRRAFFCLLSKCGSTAYKRLLLSSIPAKKHLVLTGDVHAWSNKQPDTDLQRDLLWARQDVPRFTLVRNPYSIVLSAFRDKIVRAGWTSASADRHRVPGEPRRADSAEEFAALVEEVGGAPPRAQIDGHFRVLRAERLPCSEQYSSDYVLQLEQAWSWYEPLISYLRLEDHAQRFANLFRDQNSTTALQPSRHARPESTRPCFWAPASVRCNALFNRRHTPQVNITAEVEGEAHKLRQYYTDETARLVTRYSGAFLKKFGYSPWLGPSREDPIQYLARLSIAGIGARLARK